MPKILNFTQGTAFIYMGHANWSLNIITYNKIFGGVLIRALEPLEGIDIMRKFRGIDDLSNLTNGPGKLTRALNITKDLNGVKVYDRSSKLIICSLKEEGIEIVSSYRVGVKEDLDRKLRFFIKGNIFVSKH